ncbi:MAG: 50S ribosomal protein L29 [Candidatus Bathyarchaeota archaeon]|nr:50S ribosomal protein L29 [Candidatus Bathyarchaeota archaeon]
MYRVIMKTKVLREKPQETLQKLLQENREELRRLRFDLSQGRLKKVDNVKKTKNNISRILTILNEKSKAEQS